MSNLSRLEQETIILFNEGEPTASIYTFNGKLKRRLGLLSLKFPAEIQLTKQDNIGAVTYELPKVLISVRQPMSDAQRQAARDRALASNFKPPDRD